MSKRKKIIIILSREQSSANETALPERIEQISENEIEVTIADTDEIADVQVADITE